MTWHTKRRWITLALALATVAFLVAYLLGSASIWPAILCAVGCLAGIAGERGQRRRSS